ncbi:hypothetical protein OFM39_30625, partial [Escherichia coli]|nr:hypothetical protein [Escherichia coli]
HQKINKNPKFIKKKKKKKKLSPQRLVMAFEMARAVQTPFPDPDMSSPSNNFANLSFIISSSAFSQFKFEIQMVSLLALFTNNSKFFSK